MKLFKKITGLLLVLVLALIVSACANDKSGENEIGFSLVNNGEAVKILVDGENKVGATTGDYPGVVRAAFDLQEDIESVTTKKPVVLNSKDELDKDEFVIIIGSIEKSKFIQELVDNKKISVEEIEDKWETYFHQLVTDPFNDGSIKTALVIAGSDKRGAIFGTYKISSMIGVSPWKFWVDQEPNFLENYHFEKGYYHFQDEPTVQYRGIFINDEEELVQWALNYDNQTRMGPNVYEKVFELLLRLNANYIWPAMHQITDAFNDFEGNRVMADYYGIVVGTSHPDMLMRNNDNEWDNFVARYRQEHNYYGPIEYDYTVSPEIIREYWRESVRMYKDYEVQWTLGMRGKHDEGFTAVNIDQAPWYGDDVMLLEQIIEDQRQILREELNNPTLEDVFMVFIPYKEVLHIYNKGLNVPDDVTIVWVDDNHGFIRRLSDSIERERSGGSGVYYHNSYWGPDDESYMWLNSFPFTLMYEEMSKAIEYKAVKNWVLNVGDIKPGELSMDFYLSYAYEADKYNSENVYDFMDEWTIREFGEEYVEEIKSIVKRFGNYTNVLKLEQMKVDLFTNTHFSDEWEKRMAKYQILLDDAERVFESLPAHKKGAYYQYILYQVRQAYYRNAEFYYADKAETAALYGANATAHNAFEMSRYFHELSHYENSYYSTVLSGGKWKGLMEPYRHMPPVAAGLAESGAALEVKEGGGVIVEGEKFLKSNYELKFYNFAKGRKFIDVFNSGYLPFTFTATANKDWIKLSETTGEVLDEVRLWAEIDWDKVPQGRSEGEITINYQHGTQKIKIIANNDEIDLPEKTYIEQDGYVSIEFEHFSTERQVPGAYFEVIKDLGRIEGDMVRAVSEYLVGYSIYEFLDSAPYLEYNVHFLSSGKFAAEVYRLPTLDSKGKIRFAVQVDEEEPLILEGVNDVRVGDFDWEDGIFNQIFKHRFNIDIKEAGFHKIRLYMLDPYLTFDKMVVYTESRPDSYLGPDESYNSTFNTEPYKTTYYERFYRNEFMPTRERDLTLEWGEGYFVGSDKFLIEVETAVEQSEFAYTSNPLNDGWVLARNRDGYTMRTRHDHMNYLGNNAIAPTMNFKLYVNEPGMYNVWLLQNAPMPSSSTLTLAINNIEQLRVRGLFSYSTEEVFTWKRVGSIVLVNGSQTLNVLANNTGLVIDKIYLTKTSENPGNTELYPTVRTSKLGNLTEKEKLLNALTRFNDLDNIAVGTTVGTYNQEARAEFVSAYNDVIKLYSQAEQLDSAVVSQALANLESKYLNLVNSQIKVDDFGQSYILYEDFSLYHLGFKPFGLKVYATAGSPNFRIYRDEDSQFLSVRTFGEQQHLVQKADLYYEFSETINEKFVLETRASFNEAIWGYAVYLQDESRNNAVSIAFENSNGVNKNIVAYDGNIKRVIGKFELNEFVDIKVEVDTVRQKYNVYLNGTLATDYSFNFRNNVSGIKYYMFGSAVLDAKLQYEYLKVYKEN